VIAMRDAADNSFRAFPRCVRRRDIERFLRLETGRIFAPGGEGHHASASAGHAVVGQPRDRTRTRQNLWPQPFCW
jgi:hypothetical protein